jgi:hypothetical protein
MYVDGDRDLPTIVGTGTEDYIGTGWGQGTFANRFQGCLVADAKLGQYSFYRYHVPDPVFFHKDIRVTIQGMGGDVKENILTLLKRGVPVIPVSVEEGGMFTKLLETGADLASHPSGPKAWVNVYRRDDWSAVALFYLDRPENGLPRIAGVGERTEGLQ